MAKTLIIAELSANHNQDLDLAVRTIEAMADSGADAVKIQTYRPESLTLDIDTGHFAPRTEGLWKGYTPWDLYKKASLPYEWHSELKKVAAGLGLIFFSSPFDREAVDFLETLDVPMYKIASFEITDTALIGHVASKGKPIIISTGVADDDDIQLALDVCRQEGNERITLLKCTSEYPASVEMANLLTIPDMITRYGVEAGVSDHSMGSIVPVVAVSLGATVVEKHFILDRSLGGPDHAFSSEPAEFRAMVDQVRLAESALGKVSYEISETDRNRRRSLFAVKDIKAGELITEKNIRSIRPGNGLHPKYLRDIIGRTANRDIARGTPMRTEYIG